MKYRFLTLAIFACMPLMTSTSAEARQKAHQAPVIQEAHFEAGKQAEEGLIRLLEGIFTSVREKNYEKLASFYSEEAQASVKYHFLKGDRFTKLQQVIPEVASGTGSELGNMQPAAFINTIFRHVFEQLASRLGMPINIPYPGMAKVELLNGGKEAILTYVESNPDISDSGNISEETMEFVKIAGEWRPLGNFLEDTLDELLNLLLLAQSLAEATQAIEQ
ncbi:hypothetical protein [Endozoicomonas sp.]|uniref:hypothetical protein n=1 Tax=Endozoicomonas sp. TaxID=1892382 RepID=UPI002886E4E2|nr:hypothetical protein [Endozoicomonas sp.]